MKSPKENGKCIHYDMQDEGWYCWKCLEIELKEQAKEIFDEIEKWDNDCWTDREIERGFEFQEIKKKFIGGK